MDSARPPQSAQSVRMDKWLWAARFFKTRSLAVKACDLGRITSNGNSAKPARDVRIGDRLTIRVEAGDFEVEVLGISEVRGPSAVAQALYRESDQSRARRQQLAEDRKLAPQFDPFGGAGRPSKRNRREINRLRGY